MVAVIARVAVRSEDAAAAMIGVIPKFIVRRSRRPASAPSHDSASVNILLTSIPMQVFTCVCTRYVRVCCGVDFGSGSVCVCVVELIFQVVMCMCVVELIYTPLPNHSASWLFPAFVEAVRICVCCVLDLVFFFFVIFSSRAVFVFFSSRLVIVRYVQVPIYSWFDTMVAWVNQRSTLAADCPTQIDIT